jgi:hypothetical protein
VSVVSEPGSLGFIMFVYPSQDGGPTPLRHGHHTERKCVALATPPPFDQYWIGVRGRPPKKKRSLDAPLDKDINTWAAMQQLTIAGWGMVLVNLGFLVAGALLLKFTYGLESSGWTDALQDTDYADAADGVLTAVKVLGGGAIVLAVLGCVGAALQNRVLLLAYSIVMILAMSAFGVVGGTAYTYQSKMADWEATTYPGEDQEEKLGEAFNEVYCFSEGYYFCNNASAQTVFALFVPTASAAVVSLLPNTTGIASLCDEYETLVEGMDTVCTACNASTAFAQYDKILTWAESTCPRTNTTSLWCAGFLAGTTDSDTYSGSPYEQCRTIFLDVAEGWASSLTIMGLLVAVMAALIVALSCFARRSKKPRDSEDFVNKPSIRGGFV